FEIVENEGTGLVSNQKKFLATTDTETGIASCPWEVDSFTPVQRVEARLLDVEGKAVHLPIRFTARLSTASAVAYDPSDCTDLKNAGVANVQQAIDALCAREGPAETPGIVIVDLRLLGDERPLANNEEYVWQIFLQGFRVTVDQRLDPATISRPTCYLTIDIPYPLGGYEQENWGNPFVGYRSLTLDATLETVENQITWVPAQDNITREFIGQLFNMMSEYGLEQRILARFTLKGNFIHDEGPRLYLDGEAFGLPPGRSEHNLTLPSGDGRRGGDFEMWFWLNNLG
ncbi:MAG TPA: hypothetical protein VD767_09130, partial [Thermomicrobiales bacterium]|nr:hypothetical protein [Thermomicrobiales bacterium]